MNTQGPMEHPDRHNMQNNSQIEQYLSFYLEKEEFGVDILKVMEIRGWEEPTEVPLSPGFVKGVINIRGKIIPVIDLRERFNLPFREYSKLTVVIVLQVQNKDKDRVIGIAVDAVSDVHGIDKEHIQPPPEMNNSIAGEYIKGIVISKEKMLILLDTEAVLDILEFEKQENG